MPNIFDGFEETNPEETAEKLGIKKDAIQKEVAEVFSNEENENPSILPMYEYADDRKWTDNYELKEIPPGTRVRFANRSETGSVRILGISQIGEITLLYEKDQKIEMEGEKIEYSKIITIENHIEFIDEAELYKPDLESLYYERTTVKDVSWITEGSILWDHNQKRPVLVNDIGSNIDEDGSIFYYIQYNGTDSRIVLPSHDLESGIELLQLKYPNNTLSSFTSLTEEEIENDGLWEDAKGMNFSKIKLGTRIRQAKRPGKVVSVDNNSITVSTVNGMETFYNTSESIDFEIYKEDMKDMYKNITQIASDQMRTSEFNPFKHIKKNVRLRAFRNGKMEGFYITDVNQTEVTVISLQTPDQVEKHNITDIYIMFQMLLADMPEKDRTIKKTLGVKQIKDDKNWKRPESWKELKLGMRLRCEHHLHEGAWTEEQIIELDHKKNRVGCLGEVGFKWYPLYEFTPYFNLYKDDLPQTPPFQKGVDDENWKQF